MRVSDPGDEQAKKFLVDEIKEAIEMLEAEQKAKPDRKSVIKGQIKNYKRMKAFWENIKAGSCVPPDVLQTMRQVANDRQSSGYSDNCPAMCKAAGDWFGNMNPGPQTDIQKKLFVEQCLADCS